MDTPNTMMGQRLRRNTARMIEEQTPERLLASVVASLHALPRATKAISIMLLSTRPPSRERNRVAQTRIRMHQMARGAKRGSVTKTAMRGKAAPSMTTKINKKMMIPVVAIAVTNGSTLTLISKAV